LTYVHQALEQGWHVVAAAKGALVRDFKNISARAKSKGLALKFSGATAAALPALDVGLVSLAGVEILKIEGILNGTTNFILTRMGEGCSYADALREAQVKGIAEPDPSMDVEGWDTACKLLLIANAVAGADLELEDIHVEGISGLSYEFIRRAKDASQAVKLLGKVDRREDGYHAEVVLSCLEKSHPLFSVDGANKAISFFTDTMGAITISGGKSDPRGAAAALLKDIINIYRAA
jgi:homoserine dehydrogenase